MKLKLTFIVLFCFCISLSSVLASENSSGKVKIGYVFVDEEGSLAVNQPTYNSYEGASLSIEQFQHTFDNSIRLYGNMRNITLNNRNLSFGVTKRGLFGATIRNNQYRRTYDINGQNFTRRQTTSTNLWVQPSEYIRLFGSYGMTNKSGSTKELFDLQSMLPVQSVEYGQNYFSGGVKLMYERSYLQAEYRSTTFEDDLASINNRNSNRIRLNGLTQISQLEDLILFGGFQHFEAEVEEQFDTLSSNTAWGGFKAFYGTGYSLKYNFIWDRSTRTGDLVATDNIAHTFNLGKTWVRKGGISVGYKYSINDDVVDEIQSNGYLFSGWYKPVDQVTLRGSYGADEREVQSGSILTGNREYSRHRSSVRYELPNGYGFLRAMVQMKKTENDEIGSSADFLKGGADGMLVYSKYGEFEFEYSYLEGDYLNSGDQFIFSDHIISGDLLTSEYMNAKLGFGGTYVRSRQNVDVESSQLRFSGLYSFMGNHTVEVKYTIHNFDNLANLTPVYTEFYTANIVEAFLTYTF